MAIRVLKRDGKKVEFDIKKIYVAIKKAATNENIKIKPLIARKIAKIITFKVRAGKKDVQIEEIQDLVVNELKKQGYEQLANKYQEYRLARTKTRESKLKIMDDIHKIGIQTDRDNANVGNNFSAKLLRIASEANKWHILSQLLPVEFANAHIDGDLYIHDLDSYNLTTNCLQIPTGKLLAEGFDNGYGYINSPKSIEVAAELSCIMLQSSQNDLFGGQGHPNFDNDLAPYVKLTYQKILAELKQQQVPKKEITKLARAKLIRSVSQAMQSVVYNLNSMHSRAGSQVPFSSLNIGIPDSPEAAMICQAFLEEYLKGLGNGEQPIFPNVIFRVKKGVNRDPGDPYYYLFKIACHTASQRMNPTFMNIDADFNMQHYENGIYPATMGCRTYVMSNVNGKQGSEGRGNIAPNTINIVRLAITAKKDINKFFTLFDEKIDLAKRQLLHRYDVLKKLKAVDLPFAAGQRLMVGSEKLKPNDSIEPILKQGTWSIGFIGLAETLKLLTGKHHGESKEAQELGLRIVSHLRNRLDEFKRQYKMNWSCYATPAEGLSNKFTILDEKKYGSIPWITSKGFYTNSFHIPVDFPISYAEKIAIEAPYHKLCNAGHISYIEFDATPTGEQIERIVRHAYTTSNINYIGINFHIRYCLDCAKKIKEGKKTRTKKMHEEALKSPACRVCD